MRKLLLIVLTGSLLPLASCSHEKKTCSATEPAPVSAPAKSSTDVVDTTVSVTPGVAGGVIEETIQASATVTALNPDKRTITLKTEDEEATYIAPPEVRNYDQIRVGDKVKATVISRLAVFVTSGTESSITHHTLVARAPKGARPGAIVAQAFELVAKVTAIDTETRRATFEFAGGETRIIQVRADVDLSKYKVGDSVVIQVAQQLTLVVD